MVFSQFLLWLLLSTSSVSLSMRFKHFCGETEYFLDREMCCDSKLSDLIQDGQFVECCMTSGKTYKPASEICCGDTYNKTRFESQNFSCCNGTPIKKEKEMCCGGARIMLGEGRRCCGNKSYDVNTGQCCGDQLYHWRNFKGHCCGSETYDNRTHQCHRTNSFVEVLPTNTTRCGNEIINMATHTCCDEDTPVDITNYNGDFPPVCCKKSIIPDKNAFHCELDHILPKNQSLCIRKTEKRDIYIRFTPSVDWCCNGTVERKNSTSGRKEKCCGSKVIDSITHGCCANKHPYSNFQYCCGETVVYSREMCCGKTKLNEDQVCCNESNRIFPVEKQQKFHDGCCNGKSYQRAAGTCRAADNRKPRCGKEAWDLNKDTCCNNRLYKGITGANITCCGAYIRNTTYQDCIYGRPVNRTIKNNERKRNVQLCGRKKNITVKKRKDRCCRNRFYKNAKLKGLWCCGADVYDKTSHKCCSNRVVPLNSTSCKRHRRHDSKNSPSSICSSQTWLRARVLKNMDCIQHAYLMKRESRGRNYRIKKDLVQKKNKRRNGTIWNAEPLCNHVLSRKRFILITNSSSEIYTLKYSKKVRNFIKSLRLCGGGG